MGLNASQTVTINVEDGKKQGFVRQSCQLRVAAVIVNWNARRVLRPCVEALLDIPDLDLEVVVVDNASTDDSLEMLHDLRGRIRVVQTGRNLGFGTGINRGAQSSDATFVLVLNPDVVLDVDSASKMVRFLEHNPSVGLVGPKLLDDKGRPAATCGRHPHIVAEVCRKFLLHLILPWLTFGRQRPTMPKKMGWVTGACFLVRRKAMEAVGGLDERIFMYYEDVDFCLRLRAAGWEVGYLPEATGHHSGGASSQQVLEQMLIVSETSYRLMIRRHLGLFAARLLTWLTPVEMGMRTLIWQTMKLVYPACREEAQERIRAYQKIMTRTGAEVHVRSAG